MLRLGLGLPNSVFAGSLPSFTIATSVSPEGGGTVTGAGVYKKGQTVTVDADALAGYGFVAWKEGEVAVSLDPTYSFTAEANRTLTAEFEVVPPNGTHWGYAMAVNGSDEYASFAPVLGSQLALNNSFTSWGSGVPTSWTKVGTTNGTNYIEESPAGSLHIVSDGAAMGVSQNILTIGDFYHIVVDVTINSGSIKIQMGTGSSSSYIINATGLYIFDKWADGSDGVFMVVRNAACNASVASVNIWKIMPCLDVCGDNLITNHNNWDFELATPLNWATGGNHAVARSSSNPKLGAYSLRFTVTGTGDSTTNNGSLSNTYFTALTAGGQYHLQFWCFPDTASRTVNWQIGDKSGSMALTANAQNLVKSSFIATANTVGQPLKIWFTGGNLSAYVDEIWLSVRQDFALSAWFRKTDTTGGGIFGKTTGGAAADKGFFLGFKNDSNLVFESYQGADTQTLTKADLTDTNWHLATITVSGNTGRLYLDGTLIQEDTTFPIGVWKNGASAYIGRIIGALYYMMNGDIGEIQFTRFDNLALSDFDATLYYLAGIPKSYTGGNPVIDLHLKWAGATDELMLANSGTLAVSLTGNNITQANDQLQANLTYITRD